jgi:hypothetical protein
MLFGRFIYGLCAENMTTSSAYIICKWFKDDILSFAFGICTSLGYLAKALNGYLLPLIYNDENYDNLGWALSIGVGVLLVTFICAILATSID